MKTKGEDEPLPEYITEDNLRVVQKAEESGERPYYFNS
jgi:hypothetical protein